jgi:predicted RNA-binding protein with EMAP domain
MVNEESIDKLKNMVNQLIKTEEEVVDLTGKAIDKAENAALKYLLQGIQHDSRKHADFGRAALEILEFKAIVGVKERKEVWDLLEKHRDLEKKHREFVAEIKYLTKTPALQYVFEQIWEDEKKHHMILETLMTKRFEKDPETEWGFLLGY